MRDEAPAVEGDARVRQGAAQPLHVRVQRVAGFDAQPPGVLKSAEAPDGQPDYEFRYWEDSETGERYDPDDPDHNSVTFNGSHKDWDEQEVPSPDGGTWTVPYKEQTTYAYWQPAAGVDYHVNGELDQEHSTKSFEEDVPVYDYTPEQLDGAAFEGWYTDESFETRYDDDAAAELPEITKDPGTVNRIAAYARYVIDLVVSKIWDDGNNADRIRSDSVNVDLYSGEGDDRAKVGETTLNSGNGWRWIFEGLTAFDASGNKIVYSVEESQVPAGYTAAVAETEDGFAITNSHTPTPPGPGIIINPPMPDPDPDPEPEPDPDPEPEPEPPEVIPDPEVPQAEPEDVPEDPVPLAPGEGSSWALINLLCTIGTALTALGMGLTMKQKDQDKTAKDESKLKTGKLLGILPCAAAVITFLLTEDMRNPMVLVDKWTLLMAVYFVGDLALGWFTRRKEAKKEEAVAV